MEEKDDRERGEGEGVGVWGCALRLIVMADKIVSTGTWHTLSPFGTGRRGTNVYVYSTHKDYKDKDQMPAERST